MSPRQEFKPVPYAQSLKPGAKIISSGYPAIHAESTHPSGRGIRGYATADSGTNFGVVGASKSPNGYGGYFYNNEGGYGVYGTGKYGGYFTTNQGGTHDNRNAGVNVTTAYEYSDGVRAYTTGDYSRGVCVDSTGVGRDGVRAHTTGDCSHGVRAYTTGDNSYGVCAHTTGVGSVGVRVATTGDYSSGVTALTSGTNSSGVYARSTNYHGVYGITDSADSAGVYARGIDSGADLILGGNGDKGVKDDGRIYSDPEYTSSDIFLISNDGIRINLDNDGDGEDADFEIYDKDDNLIFNVDESGDMYASGTKSAVVATKDYGTRKMYALESTEVWFEDFGMT
ncbi:MAG: hypothetical protein ACNYVW_09795, partial [Methanosarcinales archaeon]